MVFTKLATVAQVQAYYSGLTLTTSTRPTSTQVETWLDQGTSQIYGALRDRYIVPVTDAADLLQLQDLCERYTIKKIDHVLGKNTRTINENKVLVPHGISMADFFKTLKLYKEGEILLHSTSNTSSNLTSESYTRANSITPEALKETTQW